MDLVWYYHKPWHVTYLSLEVQNSGAPDLKEMIAIQDCITIIQDYTIDSIINAVNQALQQYDKLYEVYAGEALTTSPGKHTAIDMQIL